MKDVIIIVLISVFFIFLILYTMSMDEQKKKAWCNELSGKLAIVHSSTPLCYIQTASGTTIIPY